MIIDYFPGYRCPGSSHNADSKFKNSSQNACIMCSA
jgi:hypothetical protein